MTTVGERAAPADAVQRTGGRAWREPVLLGIGTIAATTVLAVGDPNTTHVPLCPLKAITGLDCPFCGSLRAVHSLARLHPGEAANHNLLFTVAAPFLVVAWAVWLARSLRHPHDPDGRPRLPRAATLTLVAVAAAFFLLRNLAPFGWLDSAA